MDNHPLPFNINPQRNSAATLRSGIVATINNLRSAERRATLDFANGTLTAVRVVNQHQTHRNLVQHLTQLANRHAHLCHTFESAQLVFHNIAITEDPTCQRAIHQCAQALSDLGITNSNLVSPTTFDDHRLDQHCHPIRATILAWYSLAFNCSEHDFHQAVWNYFVNHHHADDDTILSIRDDDDDDDSFASAISVDEFFESAVDDDDDVTFTTTVGYTNPGW